MIYGSHRAGTSIKKAFTGPDAEADAAYSNFDKYLAEQNKRNALQQTAQLGSKLSNMVLRQLRENSPEANDMVFFNTRGGDMFGVRNDPENPEQRSFYMVDMGDDNSASLLPVFSLPESMFGSPLSALNADMIDKKTLASFSPLYKTLDPATVESVRGMYDEADGKYVPKAVYRRAMEAPVWDITSIAAVPGRETAPVIGRMPLATRSRWKAKGEASPEAPIEEVKEEIQIEEPAKEEDKEPEKATEPTTRSASELFIAMRGARRNRNSVVTDDAGNVDIVKSSTSSLFKSRMKGNRI